MTFLLNLLGVIVGVVLGGYILFAGRHAIWATLGIISLSVSANLLAVLVAGLESGRELIIAQAWGLGGIAVLVAVLGTVLGWKRPDTAVQLIGFAAGADLSLWLYEISTYLVTDVVRQSEQIALGVGLVILIIGGLLGLWLIRKQPDETLILITMLIGAKMIQDAWGLSKSSSWTAIIMITLALAGVLVQYAVYLRELKADENEPRPHASSIAYFQDLELDL